MSDPRPKFVPMSRFLTVPLEIRRNIYRFLLLNPCETYLSTPWEQKDVFDYSYDDDDKNAEYYPLVDQPFGGRSPEAPWVKKSIWKIREGFDSLDLDVRRYPNILRINRQIYSEASSMLYSELRVNLQPGDVICMKACKDIVKASEKVWRHNPLDGIGTTYGTGETIYSKPRLDGVMEPHVLARFKKFAFELDIHWEAEKRYDEIVQRRRGNYVMQHGAAPSLFVHKNMTVYPQDEANLLAFYRNSTLIHQLVKILSNSPDIVSLDMTFEFEALVRDGSSGNSDPNGDVEVQPKMADVANGRAMEIFMDGGFFAPMEKLSNVRSFGFQFTGFLHNGEDYEPKPRHERMLADLKQRIKDNYARRHQ